MQAGHPVGMTLSDGFAWVHARAAPRPESRGPSVSTSTPNSQARGERVLMFIFCG